ncbi:phosphoglucosamine mutase [soil metagenome]
MKFGTDGVRGVANTELTASFALRLGRVAAHVIGAANAVIGGDTRRSTPMLVHAVAAGLASAGVSVRNIGVVPTPVVAFEASRRPLTLGVMVSASHNSFGDNGIKLFAPGGLKLTDEVQEAIEEALASPEDTPSERDEQIGNIEEDAVGAEYARHVLGAIEGRSLHGLRIILDAANGAGHELGPALLAAAGADVTGLHVSPDGVNINAGCGATDPASLARAVVEEGADLGLALDGDADRLIAVDHEGRIVDGDHVLAVCALDLRSRGLLHDDTVVVTVMTNLGFRLAMRDAGITVVDTAVGDRYVLEALERDRLSLGGEQSGHVIFRELSTTGDGIMTGLLLADIVARAGRPLAELAAAAMTSLPQTLVNVQVVDADVDWPVVLAEEIDAVERELGDHGRVLVRASGTEPVVRVMVEAPTQQQANGAARRLAGVIAAHGSWIPTLWADQ